MAAPAKSRANLLVGGIVAAVVVAALVAMAVMRLAGGDGQLCAVVHDSEGGTIRLALSEDAVVPVTTDLGTNVVEVRDGAVFVREADCDGQDCVHQGSIDVPGKQLICLPHKLWIEVVPEGGQDGAMDADAVAGDGAEGADAAREGLDAVAR